MTACRSQGRSQGWSSSWEQRCEHIEGSGRKRGRVGTRGWNDVRGGVGWQTVWSQSRQAPRAPNAPPHFQLLCVAPHRTAEHTIIVDSSCKIIGFKLIKQVPMHMVKLIFFVSGKLHKANEPMNHKTSSVWRPRRTKEEQCIQKRKKGCRVVYVVCTMFDVCVLPFSKKKV